MLESWESRVRATCTATTPGPCPLDVSLENISRFTQRGAALVDQELALLEPKEAADAAKRCAAALGVESAFALRAELISLKKVCLTLHKELTEVARGLRQVVAFTRGPSTSNEDTTEGGIPPLLHALPPYSAAEAAPKHAAAGGEAEADREGPGPSFETSPSLPSDSTKATTMQEQHGGFCDGLSQCKGALAALLDLRQVAKDVVCVPRHPAQALQDRINKKNSSRLSGLPASMKCWRLAALEVDGRTKPEAHDGSSPSCSQQAARAGSTSESETAEIAAAAVDPTEAAEASEVAVAAASAEESEFEILHEVPNKKAKANSWKEEGCAVANASPHAFSSFGSSETHLAAVAAPLGCWFSARVAAVVKQEPVLEPHHIRFLELVLIARGAAKAMLVRKEALHWLLALEATTEKLEAAANAVAAEHPAVSGGVVPNATDALAASAADAAAEVKSGVTEEKVQEQVSSNSSNDSSRLDGSAPQLSSSIASQRKVIGAALRARDKTMTVSTCNSLLGDVAKWLRVLLEQHSEGSGFATNSANEGYNSSTSTSSTSTSTSTSTRSRDNVDVGGSSSGSIGNTSKNNAGKAYLHNTGAAPGKRQQRLFVAGDHAGTSLVVPTGFVASAQVRALTRLESQGRASMLSHLSSNGWPPWIVSSSSLVDDSNSDRNAQSAASVSTTPTTAASAATTATATERCGWCCGSFQRLWVHRGVCCQCEANLRQSGQCPLGAIANRPISRVSGVSTASTTASVRGGAGGGAGSGVSSSAGTGSGDGGSGSGSAAYDAGAADSRAAAKAAARTAARLKAGHVANVCPGQKAWCPHSNRCAVCDSFGCLECRLLVGDGEDVRLLAANLQPWAIFLDFDRTLATTRGGGSPLVGCHSIDADLLQLCQEPPPGGVHIVTRNSCRDDIRTWLRQQGAPDTVQIHSVVKKQPKSDVVCDPQWLPPPPSSSTQANKHFTDGIADEIAVGIADEKSGGGVTGGRASSSPIPQLHEHCVIFADDSVSELLEHRVADHPQVIRVLFTRAR